mmetsp:Transcript_22048/g.54524  ORF Transcript_22048/g.54524 Transcript_22048/m.54524 type:complete len:258 (+) Transcript_22048:3-776(+)
MAMLNAGTNTSLSCRMEILKLIQCGLTTRQQIYSSKISAPLQALGSDVIIGVASLFDEEVKDDIYVMTQGNIEDPTMYDPAWIDVKSKLEADANGSTPEKQLLRLPPHMSASEVFPVDTTGQKVALFYPDQRGLVMRYWDAARFVGLESRAEVGCVESRTFVGDVFKVHVEAAPSPKHFGLKKRKHVVRVAIVSAAEETADQPLDQKWPCEEEFALKDNEEKHLSFSIAKRCKDLQAKEVRALVCGSTLRVFSYTIS